MHSVLVTGANRGIGLEFVRQLLQQQEPPPRHVFACCRRPEEAEELESLTKEKHQLKIIKLDVTDETTFPEAVAIVEDAVGEDGLCVLINNAGILQRGSTESTTMADMEESYKVNVMGPLAVTQAFLPALKRAAKHSRAKPRPLSIERAAVVNITSALGSFKLCTSSRYIPYRTTKAALHMLTKCMTFDLTPQGIMVVALHTGWVQTAMGGWNATLTPQTSIKGMLSVLRNLKEKDAGKAFTWEGKLLPW